VLQAIILLFAIGIFGAAAYADIRTRRIPNELVVALLALAAFRIAVTGDPAAALYTLVAGAALFVATFLLFWRGLLGGGDVKLMVATAFLVGYHDVLGFLFVMSLSGGLMAVAILAGNRLGWRRAATPAEQALEASAETSARLTVPYGVAIAAAGIMTLLVQSFPPG
jgi:prepilin peptidase CpaA